MADTRPRSGPVGEPDRPAAGSSVPRRAVRWVVRRLGRHRWFAVVMSRILPPTDRIVHRLTRGRVTVTELVVPVLMLESTGHASGRPRRTPLTFVELEDGAVAVTASNFGQASHPAWSENLLADPRATVTRHGETWAVRARLADEEERARLWPAFERVWPVYRLYRERTTHRGIRMFVLEPVDRADTPTPQV